MKKMMHTAKVYTLNADDTITYENFIGVDRGKVADAARAGQAICRCGCSREVFDWVEGKGTSASGCTITGESLTRTFKLESIAFEEVI